MSNGKRPDKPTENWNDIPETMDPSRDAQKPKRPAYMTVGSGSTSESASRLMAMLDDDSGYGGSIMDGESASLNHWHPGLMGDVPTGGSTPRIDGEYSPQVENERKIMASHIHQLHYNQNKTSLARSITRTADTLRKLQEMNQQWPAHYPTVQRPHTPQPTRRDPRPGLQHTQTSMDLEHNQTSPLGSRPSPLRRSGTSIGETSTQAESSASAAARAPAEPRLVTPQLAQDFSVLKIDLKLGNLNQTEIVHSLEKHSISTLLDNQISKTVRHLYSLRDRIEDTASKVLVTGDLNAGKSTFCNALLRRKVLPEDQQPCTSIFCEILDVRENGGIEEVHAIPVGVDYKRDDERTYRVFAIEELEKVVIDNDRWSQCKIFVKDIRSVDASILNNGVVDIALIDAPGLNNDSIITTANFAKQEEIDVVVFVVSAANHFTQSAKEFVFNAAREKAYIFMVVNGFDNIRDKQRCQDMILKQVQSLSPATFKESAELVHFVSSNAIPVAGPGQVVGGSGGSGSSASGPGGPGDDGDGDDGDASKDIGKNGDSDSVPKDKGKGKDREKIRDFEELEASLRRFVLEKRARSKLAPAKTYLMNVLGDLNSLANVNRDVAQQELDRVTKDLQQLEPELEKSKKATHEAGDGSDQTIEKTVTDVYDNTRSTLETEINTIAERDLGIEYPGIFSAYQYAEDLREAMLQDIQATVKVCEDAARGKTVEGANAIKSLGLLHLGNNFSDFSFRSENMFTRRKDQLARQLDVDIELIDFFDVNSLWERQEKVAGTSMALTVAGLVGGRLVGGASWIDGALGAVRVMGVNNVRRLAIPGVIAGVILIATYAIYSIPTSLPKRLSQKLPQQLHHLDYIHSNSSRISSEVRRALKYPADNLRLGLKRNIDTLVTKRAEVMKLKGESEVARKYFGNLLRDAGDIRAAVERVDLEGPAPGIAARY